QALVGRDVPVVGYMGTFDSRVDMALLLSAAEALPGLTFALPGRVNGDCEAVAGELRALPNVVMPGPVDFEEGESYAANFDVGLIPFRPGRIGDAINPVKMWMYLARGTPVVGTDTAEMRRHRPYVEVA